MPSKRSLAVALSKLAVFESAKVELEQYATDSNIAATVLWHIYMDGLIEKNIVDLGAGTGILAIGAALLGAKVIAIEKDDAAIKLFEANQDIAGTDVTILHTDVESYAQKCDVVIMNPPFGTKEKHADRMFLQKACSLADIVYTIHKSTTLKFIEQFSQELGFSIFWQEQMSFPLPKSMTHHKKDRERVDVVVLGLRKD